MKELTCPSCGNKIQIEPGIINYVCPYCNTILFYENEEVKTTGEKSEIIPFPTKLEFGKVYYIVKNKDSNSEINGINVDYISEKDFDNKQDYLAKVYVSGQIRYVSDYFIWNKFQIRFLEEKLNINKNKEIFAEEDEGQIKLYYVDVVDDDGSFNKIFSEEGPYSEGYFIQEKGLQTIEGFKGGFPFEIINVKHSKYLNLVDIKAKNILLEKFGKKVLFMIGI